MKKLLVFLAIFLLALTAVSAQQLTLTDVNAGGDNQEREETTLATITVTNDGLGNLTGISLANNADTEFAVKFYETGTTTEVTIFDLLDNASATFDVEVYVPEDFDAGKDTIGTITATDGVETGSSTLSLEAENNLIIRDIDVAVNDDSEDVDDGDTVDVFPASRIEITIELKNTHSTADIEDIEITIFNDDLDIDEDDDISKIKDGKKETITFSFKLDIDADEDKYDIEIFVEGEDDNGAMHGETWIIEFDLEEEGIIITDSELRPEGLMCGDDSTDLWLELSNVGTRDEDEVAIEIVATSLGYEKRVSNLVIDEDDEITKIYRIPIPEDTRSGQHVIEVRAYMDFDELTHKKFFYVDVPSGCNAVVDEEEEEEDDLEIIIIPIEDDDVVEDDDFVDSGEFLDGEWDDSFWMTTLLILGNVLLLVIIVILVIRFVFRR